jgi:hypothetical protein
LAVNVRCNKRLDAYRVGWQHGQIGARHQQSKLLANNAVGTADQGNSVALSADGNTLSGSSSPSARPHAMAAVATSSLGSAEATGASDWGTLSPTVRADRAALRDYFVTAFKVLPGLKVTFGDQLIRVYDCSAVNTGYYSFSYIKDGETKSLPARYSFTYVKSGEKWLIVDHHSSAMPPAPK